MTLNIKACEVSEVERLLLLLISWVEKTTAVLLLARTLPVDSQSNPGPTLSLPHLVCIATQLGNPSVLSHYLFGCSAIGALCLAVSACRPLLLQVLLCLAPCVVSPCAGATLGQTDPLYIIACCYILLTSGSGQTKPFFLGKSYGLLKVISIV